MHLSIFEVLQMAFADEGIRKSSYNYILHCLDTGTVAEEQRRLVQLIVDFRHQLRLQPHHWLFQRALTLNTLCDATAVAGNPKNPYRVYQRLTEAAMQKKPVSVEMGPSEKILGQKVSWQLSVLQEQAL